MLVATMKGPGPLLSVPLPTYRTCTVTVAFGEPLGSLVALRKKLVHGASEQLALDAAASNETSLLLKSTSGHSLLQLRADGAHFQTTYSGAYADHGAVELRRGYATEKLTALFDLLADAGAKVELFGVTVAARITCQEPDVQSLRDAAVRAFQLRPLFTEGEPAYDFVVRASRAVDADVFANTQASWFQERSITFQLTTDQVAQRLVKFKEWDMTLVGEGLELSYDRNNKRGLFEGKRLWPAEDLMRMLTDTLAASGGAFLGIHGAIVQEAKTA